MAQGHDRLSGFPAAKKLSIDVGPFVIPDEDLPSASDSRGDSRGRPGDRTGKSADSNVHPRTPVKPWWGDVKSTPKHWTGDSAFSPYMVPDRKNWSPKNVIVQGGKGLASAAAYSVASCSMILINKIVLSTYGWEAPVSLMLYQNALIASFVALLRLFKLVPAEPITWRIVRLWLPVNLIFVGMLVTSFYSLQYLQVAMATILKNCTNVLTALGEAYLSGTQHDGQVWLALAMMIGSAVCAGYTDLSFHPVGYMWQGLNCCLTAAYSLMLRHVMTSVRDVTPNRAPLGEFTMVLLNSMLSLPLGLFLALAVFNEGPYLMRTPLLRSPPFWAAATLSGTMGLAISFSSLWCLHTTSPTTHGLIGSMNKVPLSLLGIALFHAPTSLSNLSSICVGLVAGILFGHAKVKSQQRLKEQKERQYRQLATSSLGDPPPPHHPGRQKGTRTPASSARPPLPISSFSPSSSDVENGKPTPGARQSFESNTEGSKWMAMRDVENSPKRQLFGA